MFALHPTEQNRAAMVKFTEKKLQNAYGALKVLVLVFSLFDLTDVLVHDVMVMYMLVVLDTIQKISML